MNLQLRSLLVATILCGVALLLHTRSSFGQEAPAAEPAALEDDAPAEERLREQDIYIPYGKLREVFEKHGRGVFLPYEEFRNLWEAGLEKTAKPAELKPPVGALITEIANEATVAEDIVQVKATLKIEILAEGWNEIPLRLSDAAITAAVIDDKPARILGGPKQHYRLLVEKKGKETKQIELKLEYAKAIKKSPGINSVSFEAPLAPVSRWRVRVPQSGVKVEVQPVIAATKEPAAAREGAAAGETVVLAFVGAAPMVRIEWTPEAEGATGLTALASVQADLQVRVNEGVTRTRTDLAYTISRAELAELKIEVPADQKVVNVFDANVRQWSVEKPAAEDDADAAAAAATQIITAQLFEPAKGKQSVTVEIEKFTGEAEPGKEQTLSVPLVEALGISRQQGVVVVQIEPGLRAEAVRRSGLLQVDKGEIPDTLKRENWDFAYRYGSVPFELTLSVEKIEPRILVDSLVEADLEPQQLTVTMAAIYTIERAGVFRLELDVPEGFDVRHVHGRALAGAKAAQIDAHHVEGEKKTRLVVDLASKAEGRIGLVVTLEKDLDEPDLLAPTGKIVDIPLPIPRIAPEGVERAVGRLVVYAPESLRVNPAKSDGLRSVPFAEAFQGVQSARDGKPDLRPVLAFAYTPEPVDLELAVERRKPQVTIKQLLVARIEDGVVKYESTLFYEILYSGVKLLKIAVPEDVASELRVTTSGIRDEVVEPKPEDLPEGYVAWSLIGESELLGAGEIKLVWEKKMEELEVGKGEEIEIPQIKPIGVDRAWGQIVLAKAETLDIRESDTLKGLRRIDHQTDLIAPVDGAARAFEFHDDWALAITVTRYQLEEVKRSNIELGVVRMVATRSKQISVQAIYRMRSARQRLEVKLPQGVSQQTEARINGQPVMLQGSKDDETVRFVPLVGSNSEEPFVLEFRYVIEKYRGRFDLPVFVDEPSAQQVYLAAYLPKEWALLGATGPWTADYSWDLDSPWRWRPVSRHDENLVRQVRSGAPGSGSGEKFATEGCWLYLFYTLRPEAPPGGTLRLRAMNSTTLRLIVFLVVIAGGVLLLAADRSIRALAVGALIVLLVLCGTFAPNFSMQILNGVLAAAIFLVFVIWVVAFFFRKHLPGLGQLMRPVTADAEPPQEEPVDAPVFEETDKTTDESGGEDAGSGDKDADADKDAEADDNEEGGRTNA